MAAIPYETAQAFLLGKKHRNGAFKTDGVAVWSYAMLLATRNSQTGEITWHCDPHASVSRTTNRHLSALRAILGIERA